MLGSIVSLGFLIFDSPALIQNESMLRTAFCVQRIFQNTLSHNLRIQTRGPRGFLRALERSRGADEPIGEDRPADQVRHPHHPADGETRRLAHRLPDVA